MTGTRLEIKVDGQDVAAQKMLAVASSTVKLLRSIERVIHTERAQQGMARLPAVRWRVGMMSGNSFGLIEIWADGDKDLLTAEIDRFARAVQAKEKVKA